MSDIEWQIIEPLLPAPKERGRKIKYSRREILNAIFYLVRSGCVYRLLPHDLPPYRLVFHYYTSWRKEERRQAINDTFRTQLRVAEGVIPNRVPPVLIVRVLKPPTPQLVAKMRLVTMLARKLKAPASGYPTAYSGRYAGSFNSK